MSFFLCGSVYGDFDWATILNVIYDFDTNKHLYDW